MGQYRVLAGQHVQDDPDWEPSEQAREDAERAGHRLRNPGKTYKTGDIVESDTDLVQRHGSNKFEAVGGEVAASRDRIAELEAEVKLLQSQQATADTGEFRTPGDPTPENLAKSPAVFLGGQVSTGKQQSAPGGEGRVPSGPLSTAAATRPKSGDDAKLNAMTVPQLKEYAEDHEIDVRGAKSKDDYLRAISSAK